MFKQVLLASAILAATTGAALANPAPYAGGSLGVTVNTLNTNFDNKSYGISSYRGVPLTLFAGYGGVIAQNFYLAGELFGTVGTMNINNNNGIKTSYGYGAAILPGLMVTDHTLVYVRGGIVDSHFSSEFSNGKKMRVGAQFGAGMQTTVTQNVDIRGEYDFVAYRSMSVYGVPNVGKVTFNPRADQFTVGIIYKFE